MRKGNKITRKTKHTKYSTAGLIENDYGPGGRVLKNKLGIRKIKEIERVESESLQKTQNYFYNLFSEDPPPPITEDLIRGIHRHWLGEIYEWAGDYRRVNLGKENITFPPASLPDGTPNIPRLMKEFERDILKKYTPCRKGDDLSKVAKAIAIVHGEFEIIHPFREGNGRLGRLIASLMAFQAGRSALIFDIKEKIYYNAMRDVFANKNYDPLTKIIEKAIELGVEKARG